MITEAYRVRLVKIRIQRPAQHGTRIGHIKRDPGLGNLPCAGIDAAVKAQVDVRQGSKFHV